MTTTPTAALVEEAEALSRCATPAPWIYTRGVCLKHYVASENKDLALSFQSMHWEDGREVAAEADAMFIARARTLVPELAAALRCAEAERDAAIARAVNAEQEQADMERLLEMQHKRTRQADELWRKQHNKPLTSPDLGTLSEWLMKRAEKAGAERNAQRAEVLRLTGERDELLESVEELRALGFGLGCMLTNAQWRERDAAERAQRGLKLMQSCLQDEERRVFELTATRDLLNGENARLHERVATLELLLRGGK